MEELGLMPSSTGCHGGKRTGRKVSHYIIDGGPFEIACNELTKDGFTIQYLTNGKNGAGKAKTARLRVTYKCPCCDESAVAKPEVKLICGECNEPMVAFG